MNHEENIKNNILVLDETGKIKSRERIDLEYKETFNLGSSSKYAKTMASFANNIGGYIIFGVKDRPRQIVGVNSAFFEFKQEKLTGILNSFFAPEIMWETGTVKIGEYIVGYIYTGESIDKPIMAIKSENSEKINEGDIFYRYKARTERIKYPEMNKIISNREKRLQEHIIKMIEMIRNSNTTNIGIINYNNGKLTTPYGVDVAVDKKWITKILKNAKYIKEGSFDENGGQPVLKVTGSIELAEGIPVPDFDPGDKYKYTQKELAKELSLENYDVYALVWYYKLKEEKKYHMAIQNTEKQKLYRFSVYALQLLQEKLDENKGNKDWLKDIRKQYSDNRNQKRVKSTKVSR